MTPFEDYYPRDDRIKHLSLTSNTKLIIMSDMHRGDGTGSDDFAHNSLLYKCALDYYLENGFTYIELGDAEELWENKAFDQIYITHTSIYDQLAKFHDPNPEKTCYIKIWGNHDLQWKNNQAMLAGLFPDIRVYEAAILQKHILLWHGHQADPKCRGGGGAFSKFFVQRFWPVLQRCGIKDPTRAANNPGRCNEIDRTLHNWANHNKKGVDVIIAGHTHRPVYKNLSLTEKRSLDSDIRTPDIRKKEPDPTYYNTGCCVHPRCITGIEITSEHDKSPKLTLIKWAYSAQTESKPNMADYPDEYNLTVKRSVLEP
jgi:UDP-2,3-diacylglucosamine pyrophosphatase LpxH